MPQHRGARPGRPVLTGENHYDKWLAEKRRADAADKKYEELTQSHVSVEKYEELEEKCQRLQNLVTLSETQHINTKAKLELARKRIRDGQPDT